MGTVLRPFRVFLHLTLVICLYFAAKLSIHLIMRCYSRVPLQVAYNILYALSDHSKDPKKELSSETQVAPRIPGRN